MKRILTLILIATVIAVLAWQKPFEEKLTPMEKWQLLCRSLEAPNMSAADAAALIDKYDIDVNAVEGPAAPIQFAVYSGDVEKVRMLISRGASVQVGSSGPYSLPVIAIIDNNIPVLKELLAGGQDIECGNYSQGLTLLYRCIPRKSETSPLCMWQPGVKTEPCTTCSCATEPMNPCATRKAKLPNTTLSPK